MEMETLTRQMKAALVQALSRMETDDEHRRALEHKVRRITYTVEVCYRCLEQVATHLPYSIEDATLVDYGGGSGALTLCAKMCGWGHVIYVDNSEQALHTARQLHTLADDSGRYTADCYLLGDADTLLQHCRNEKMRIDAVVGTDVVEHIYNLERFFNAMALLGAPQLLLTTASNADNPFKCRQLHRAMRGDECGDNENPNFLTLRDTWLRQQHGMNPDEARRWAAATRGMTYADINRAVASGTMPTPEDRYNTCDPRTGNWTERIVTIARYRTMLENAGYRLTVGNGWYDTHSGGTLHRMAARWLNALHSRHVTPFILLHAQHDER